MWLDDTRGHLVDWTTQRWVRWTGRRTSPENCPWLDGPAGRPTGIGPGFFEDYAVDRGLRVLRGQPGGLIPDFEALRSATFDPDGIAPAIVAFYTRTDAYDLDAWSQWAGPFRPFGWALAVLFSRRLQQLNVPLSNLDTSRGMTSEVVSVVDAFTSRQVFTAWVRQLVATGNVIYAGAYSTCVVPDAATPCVRVVFPLPNGNAVVLMRPVAHPDGSLTLISAGEQFWRRRSESRPVGRSENGPPAGTLFYAERATRPACHPVISGWSCSVLSDGLRAAWPPLCGARLAAGRAPH